MDFPLNTADVPPLPPLKWDQFFWTGEDVLPAWAGMLEKEGAYGGTTAERASTGRVQILVASPVEGDEGSFVAPSTEQVAAYAFLKSNGQAIRAAVLRATYEDYPRLRDGYGYDEEEAEEFMPEIDGPEELRRLIGLHAVHVLSVIKDAVAYVGLEFGCTWDPEHGLGVMTHNGRVVKIGGADTSFLAWIARADKDAG